MRLKGFIPLSMVDWPNKLAAVLFTGGCNLRCTYCHNADLIVPAAPWLDQEETFADLRTRRDLLDGVVITGGEPTLQSDLEESIRTLREDGWEIKLDTNGTRPEVLKRLLDAELLDYVAMDWKVPLRGALVGGLIGTTEEMIEKVAQSAKLLAESGVECEWRTTCAHGIDRDALLQMESDLLEATGRTEINWYLQRYSAPQGGDSSAGILSPPLTLEEVKEIRGSMKIPLQLRSWAL